MCPSALNPPRADTDSPDVGGAGWPTGSEIVSAGPSDGSAATTELDLESFHDELRQRNTAALLWTVLVFTPLYVGWALFDRVLLPAQAPARTA